jgi:hypothetical protein
MNAAHIAWMYDQTMANRVVIQTTKTRLPIKIFLGANDHASQIWCIKPTSAYPVYRFQSSYSSKNSATNLLHPRDQTNLNACI